MIKSGKFICRKCKNNGMGTFTDWQRKEDKYIFGKKFEFLDFSKPNWSNVKYKWTSGKTQQWDGEDDKLVWENINNLYYYSLKITSNSIILSKLV